MKLGSVTTKFALAQLVYLRANSDWAGIVTGILLRPDGAFCYFVTWGDHEETQHFECELTDEKDFER